MEALIGKRDRNQAFPVDESAPGDKKKRKYEAVENVTVQQLHTLLKHVKKVVLLSAILDLSISLKFLAFEVEKKTKDVTVSFQSSAMDNMH